MCIVYHCHCVAVYKLQVYHCVAEPSVAVYDCNALCSKQTRYDGKVRSKWHHLTLCSANRKLYNFTQLMPYTCTRNSLVYLCLSTLVLVRLYTFVHLHLSALDYTCPLVLNVARSVFVLLYLYNCTCTLMYFCMSIV